METHFSPTFFLFYLFLRPLRASAAQIKATLCSFFLASSPWAPQMAGAITTRPRCCPELETEGEEKREVEGDTNGR